MFYETCFWVSIRRIIKAFEPRLLIHNGFSLVYHINSIRCFSKRVYTVKRFVLSNLKSPSLKSNHGKAEVTSKIIHFVRILEWSYDKRRNTKFLFLTEQAAEKVQERISLKALQKDYCKGTFLFKSGLLKSESCWMTMTIPLSLWISSSFACTGLSALSHHGVYSPISLAILQSPLLWTLKRDVKGTVYMASLCPCWPV